MHKKYVFWSSLSYFNSRRRKTSVWIIGHNFKIKFIPIYPLILWFFVSLEFIISWNLLWDFFDILEKNGAPWQVFNVMKISRIFEDSLISILIKALERRRSVAPCYQKGDGWSQINWTEIIMLLIFNLNGKVCIFFFLFQK